MALLLALVVVACSGGRSVEAYCDEVDDGFARMAANTDGSGGGGFDQFLVVVSNVGEMNRLLSRLADVAPDEIRSDVEAVADSWERQGEQIGQAASNPLAGLAQIFVDSMLVSASTEAVESWTVANCGRALFGSPPDQPVNDDGSVQGDGQVAAPLCPGLGQPVTRESDPAELVSALELAAEEGVGSAQMLANRIVALEPPPMTPWEALGRLWWDGGEEPRSAMLAVDREVEEACARPLIDAPFLDGFGEIGPRPLGEDRVLLGSYGQACSTSSAGQQPIFESGLAVMHCDGPCNERTIRILDLEDGVVSVVPVPAGSACREWPYVTDGWMYWVEADELPASGLNPARERARLLRAPTARPSESELLWTVEDEDSQIARLEIIGAYEGNVLVLEGVYEPDATLRVFGPGGDQIAEAAGDMATRPVIVWPGIVQYGNVIVDLADATLRTVEPSSASYSDLGLEGLDWYRDACTGARFEHAAYPDLGAPLTRWELGPGRTLTRTALGVGGRDSMGWADGSLPGGLLVPLGDGIVSMPSDRAFSGDYEHFGPDGELRWQLPDGVVDRAQVLNGQLFVLTVSNELIAVDSASGEETEADPQMLEIAGALLDGASLWINPLTGEAQLRSGDVVEFLRLPECAIG